MSQEMRGESGRLSMLVLGAVLDQREEYSCPRHNHACASRRILEKEGVNAYVSISIRAGSGRSGALWPHFPGCEESN